MRVILQRVTQSSVSVDGETVGSINQGLNLLVGISKTDTAKELEWMAQKCLGLRVFPDDTGKMSHSIQDINGELLVISQFTLYGDCRKGRRPSYDKAASPQDAEKLYDQFMSILRQSGLVVETGKFGAMMDVHIQNDGPVTLILEREAA